MPSSTSNNPALPAELLGLVGKQIGNYKILSVLGRGSMGIVYHANDVALLRPTAIKILHWSIKREHHDPVKWFLAEARSIASLNHPGIVQVYNVATFSGHYLIAMEFVDGDSAEALIKTGPLAAAQATEIILQAASALQAAHARNIVHRDVKPANLLVARDGQVKLTDFGLALTQLGPQTAGRIGTPFFTAPELWSGEAASPASDLYSLGATYFRLLTRRNLFEAANLEEIERLHRYAPIPDVRQFRPDVPSACADLIARCVAKTPVERFRSAGELTLAAAALLNRIGSQPDLPAIGSAGLGPTGFSPEGDPIGPTQQPEVEPWARALGFVKQPFSALSAEAPYEGEPFAELVVRIRQILGKLGTVAVIAGHEQSGRTTAVSRVLQELAVSRPVMYFDLEQSPGSLLSRVGSAVGAPPIASPEAAIRALLRKLGAATDRRRPYVIAIDGVNAGRTEGEVGTLAMAAGATETFNLLLVATGAGGERNANDGFPKEAIAVPVRPLAGFEVREYLNAWMKATLDPDQAPIIITPDAALLIGYWSGGVLGEINRIASSALFFASQARHRVITSEHVWAAARQIRDPQVPKLGEEDTPSFGWPTAAGLRGIIAECRLRCGLKPRLELGVQVGKATREGISGA